MESHQSRSRKQIYTDHNPYLQPLQAYLVVPNHPPYPYYNPYYFPYNPYQNQTPPLPL